MPSQKTCSELELSGSRRESEDRIVINRQILEVLFSFTVDKHQSTQSNQLHSYGRSIQNWMLGIGILKRDRGAVELTVLGENVLSELCKANQQFAALLKCQSLELNPIDMNQAVQAIVRLSFELQFKEGSTQ